MGRSALFLFPKILIFYTKLGIEVDFIHFLLQLSSHESTVSDLELGSSSTRTRFYRRRSKSSKGRFSTSIETLIYSKRKSCIKRKLNFDEAIDVVAVKKKLPKSPHS
jgi:hypothetical protein